MIAIVDYGVGNLFSLKSSLAAVGAEAVVTGDADALRNSIRTIYRMIVGGIGDHFTELLDIAAVVEDKINGMDPKGLEELVLSVMKRELQSIVNLGALLGFLLGFLTLLVR